MFAELLILAALLCSVAARAADPVTVVQNPLANRPVFVIPGQSFTIECKTGAEVSGWTVTLSMPYRELTLAATPAECSGGVRKLTVAVPAGTPCELYDMRVQASGGVDDRVRHCVRVLPSFENDFTFVHLPDCHLPSVAWIGFYDDPNTVPEFRQVAKEINILQPDFVLQTGDIVDNGQDESQVRLAQELLEEIEAPVFLTGGNHDLWYDAHSNWIRYFGPAMNYSFRYGPVRFIGLEMYDIPTKTYTADQIKWLMNLLDTSVRTGEKSRALFTHYDDSRQLTGDFVDRYSVDGIFYGHTHVNGEQHIGLRQALKLNTSYTMNDNGEYRLVKVRNGTVAEYPVLKFRHLRADVSPVNDGTSHKVTARIVNDNAVALENAMVKLHVRRDAAPFTVTGGNVLQFVDYGSDKRVYYVRANVPAKATAEVTVAGIGTANAPRIVNYNPKYDTTVTGGQALRFEIQADRPNPQCVWKKDGSPVPGATGLAYSFRPDVSFQGRVLIQAEIADPSGKDVHSWAVTVDKSTGKPTVVSSTRNFFPYDQEAVIQWSEPVEGRGVFEYGPVPGQTSGTIPEEGNSNRIRFTPSKAGMGLGAYYCRIKSGGLESDVFTLVVESPQAPAMIGPVGNVSTSSPVFRWEPVQGVPYYLLVLTDQEIVIHEDKITGTYSLQGANPVWAVLTSEHSVPYGAPDPSGTFTNFPAPLLPGGRYWWVVLNCYGDRAELTSTVQSGVSAFKVALPPPVLPPPVLLSPGPDAALSGPLIQFRWNPAAGASGYRFYPFKTELEEGVEVVRPVWETVITTSNTVLEYDASEHLVKGNYQWKVSAVDPNGNEVPSETRRFNYDAPSAVLNIRTFDGQGTASTGDDLRLPRVNIAYDAVAGVDMGLPLSTDKQGERLDLLFAPGTYAFIAEKEGYAPFCDTLSLVQDRTADLDIRLSPDPSALTGRVLDAEGNPVEAALIRIRHSLRSERVREGASDRNGNFSVSLTAGPWIVNASKEGYQASAAVSVSVQSGEILKLASPLMVRRFANRIQGIVLNASGQPVYGAAVEVSSGGTVFSMTTDTDGRFGFSVPDGSWLLKVAGSGFASPSARWHSVSGGRTLEVSPSPQLVPSGSLVAGTVTDGLRAVAGTVVRATPASGPVVTTVSDAYGNYVLTLPSGYYRLSAAKEGYTSTRCTEASVDGKETVTGVPVFVEGKASSVSGLVTVDGFTPLPGASVRFNEATATADAGGRYQADTAPGNIRIAASKTGYLNGPPVDVSVVPFQRLENIDFVLAPNASVIKGQVYSSSGGVSGARLQSAGLETWTDENGNYSFHVGAGTYGLTTSKPGFQPKTVQVVAGQAQTLEGNHFPLERNATALRGKVTEKPSGAVLMGVRIDIPELGISTVSKQDGQYRFDLEPSPKGYALRVSKDGYESRILSTGNAAGNEIVLDIQLRVFSSQLRGKVLDERGEGVGSAEMTATAQSEIGLAATLVDGGYTLYLPPEGGAFRISITKKGYAFSGDAETVVLAAGEKRTRDFRVQNRFARLKGNVFSNAEAFVSRASVKLKTAGGILASTGSDEAGNFDFIDARGNPFLPEGTYDLVAGKPGYRDTLVTAMTLSIGSVRTVHIGLTRHTGFLEGTITDGSLPLPDVTVEAAPQGLPDRFTRVTDDKGYFRLDRIPAGRCTVKLSKPGYTFPKDTTVVAPKSGLSLVLSKNRGRFWGKIVDRETNSGIAYAGVLARDGRGNESRVTASGDGSYDMTLLPTLAPYSLQATGGGYHSVTRENVSATRTDTTLFRLQRIYGSVAGKVMLKEDRSPVPNVVVRITAGAVVLTDTTDGDGQYRAVRLSTNLYYVSVEKPGHLATPSYQSVNLYGGGDKTGVDFMLEKVSISSLSISGPSSIECGRSVHYSYSAKTANGRQISISPKWSADPPAAVDSLGTGGVLLTRPDFTGPLKLYLLDGYSSVSDSVLVHAVATVRPGDPEKHFRDYRGAVFTLPAGCTNQILTFGLKFPTLPDAKRLMSDYEAAGRLYAFQPAGLSLSKSMLFSLPLPEGAGPDVVLGKWNANRLAWDAVQGSQANGSIRAETDLLTQWTVLSPSEPLGIREFQARPNPFSPFLETLKLSFVPTSNVSPVVFVSVNVYNINGDPVRQLMTEEGLPKGRKTEIFWNGRTDSGAMALNGRYLIRVEVRDGRSTDRKLVPVVMIK